ncbi:MAG: hypothetical protein LJE84_01490 [Gammaproteobacteria bacterium]|nr:hypothetical protein [Gammaproteobacteria bacterium]
MRIRPVIAAAAFFLCPSSILQAASPGHYLYLTANAENNVPRRAPAQEFDCFQRIYAVVELDGYPRGTHQLEVVWQDPYRRVRERTRYDFHIATARTRTWAWLELRAPRATVFARFFLRDSADGMQEFIGEWLLKLLVDGRQLESRRFSVSC